MKKQVTIDDVINQFYFQYFRVVKKTYIQSNGRNYIKAKADQRKLLAFTKVTNLINEYNIDYVDYISNTFEYYKKYINPKTLINVGNLQRYKISKDEKENSKSITFIYNEIMKSINFITLQCKVLELSSVTEYIKYCINNDLLSMFLMCGKISKYYLAMINNIEMIASLLSKQSASELKTVVINNREMLDHDARNAILKFNGHNNVSIIKITNHYINKEIGSGEN